MTAADRTRPAVSETPDTTTPAVTEEDRAKTWGCRCWPYSYPPPPGTRHFANGCEVCPERRPAALAAERGKADALRAAMHALASDFQANGNGCALGDPSDQAWFYAAARLRAIADGQR